MTIENPMFSRYQTYEFYLFSKRVLPFLDQLDAELLGLARPLAEAQKAHYVLQSHFNSNQSLPCNQSLVNADGVRNDAIIGFKHYLLACQKRANPEWNVNARLLIEVFKKYGWNLELDSGSGKTEKLESLIKEMQELQELKNAIKILSMEDWLKELVEAQSRFVAAYRNSVEEETSGGSCTCTQIRNSFDLIFRYIDLMQQIQPNILLSNIISDINDVINEFNSNIRSRGTSTMTYETTRK